MGVKKRLSNKESVIVSAVMQQGLINDTHDAALIGWMDKIGAMIVSENDGEDCASQWDYL